MVIRRVGVGPRHLCRWFGSWIWWGLDLPLMGMEWIVQVLRVYQPMTGMEVEQEYSQNIVD